MSPKWERVPAAPAQTDAKLFLDAVLRPHRSLSLGAFKVMLAVVIVFNVVVATVFWLRGAFPVAGFAGLDVLALGIAFRVNYNAAKAEEHVRIDRERIHVERRRANGAVDHWVASPVWAKAVIDGLGVSIRTGGRALRVAAFLSPDERAAFARQLDDALWHAKRGF